MGQIMSDDLIILAFYIIVFLSILLTAEVIAILICERILRKLKYGNAKVGHILKPKNITFRGFMKINKYPTVKDILNNIQKLVDLGYAEYEVVDVLAKPNEIEAVDTVEKTVILGWHRR